MTVVSEMLGVPTPGFEWVYPPRTRCWRLLCRGVSDGFFLALLLAPQFFRNSISDFLKASTAWIAFLGFLGFLGLGLPAVLGVRVQGLPRHPAFLCTSTPRPYIRALGRPSCGSCRQPGCSTPTSRAIWSE